MANAAPAPAGLAATSAAADLGPAEPAHLNRDFRTLWLSRTLGQTAANTAQFGSLIIIVAGSDSGLLASLVVLAWVLPGALLSVVSGLLVDAVPKRWLLTAANALRAAGCFVFLTSAQGTPQVFELVIFLSALGPFIGPAESALVPTLVQRDRLTAANAFLNFMRYVAQVAGLLILAPLLTRTAGVETLFAVTGALFAAAAVYAALIPPGEGAHEPAFPDEAARIRRGGLGEALRFLRDRRDVRAAVVQLSLLAAVLPLLVALAPVYLREVLDQRVSDLPLIFLPAVIGMLLGLRLVSVIVRRRDAVRLSAAGLALFLAGLVALALIEPIDEALGAALGLVAVDLGVVEMGAKTQLVMLIVLPMGFAFSLVSVAAHAVLNARAPLAMQGRIFAVQMLLAGAAAIPPLLGGGALTEVVDVRVVLGLVPALLVLTWAWTHWARPARPRFPALGRLHRGAL